MEIKRSPRVRNALFCFFFYARGFVLNASCECLRVKKKRDIVLFLFVVFFNVINEMSLLCCAAVELARDFFSFNLFSR